MKKPIYLDYMATTPVDPRVIERMLNYLGPDTEFGNPASKTHQYGLHAAEAVETARLSLAETIGAEPQSLIFTSGATEANNLAILGSVRFYQRKGRHLITMSTEHKSVLDSFHQLEQEGFEVTYLNPEPDGLLDINRLKEALRPDTLMVSVMHVNNEIGVIQDIASIGNLLKNQGILFHVDAAQSIGKLPINLKTLPVDLMAFSAHKVYGPKGVGALYLRQKPRIRLQPLSFGGGHEQGLRSGTLPTHQIIGLSEAVKIANACREEEQPRIGTLRDHLWSLLKDIPGIQLNGSMMHRIAANLNVSFKGIPGDRLIPALHEIAVSSTSACLSASSQPSYVLRAIGLSDQLAYSTIRLSLGRFTTPEEVTQAADIIHTQIQRLQTMGV